MIPVAALEAGTAVEGVYAVRRKERRLDLGTKQRGRDFRDVNFSRTTLA